MAESVALYLSSAMPVLPCIVPDGSCRPIVSCQISSELLVLGLLSQSDCLANLFQERKGEVNINLSASDSPARGSLPAGWPAAICYVVSSEWF